MTAQKLLDGRSSECWSDFALDGLVAKRAGAADALEQLPSHLQHCARCAERLQQFERVNPPPLLALDSKRAPSRSIPRARALQVGAGLTLLVGALAGALQLNPLERDAPESRTTSASQETRVKGGLSLTVIVKRRSGEVVRLAPRDVVSPGESLRFELLSAEPGFVGVVGIDAARAVTVYSPASGNLPPIAAAAPNVLPETIIADETLGRETLIAIRCPETLPTKRLQADGQQALEQAGGDQSKLGKLNPQCLQTLVEIEKAAVP